MMSKIIIVYKKVGKQPEFKKIENSINEFENLVGGDINTLNYENEFTIVYKKDNTNLQPNIYVNTAPFSIGETLRGTVLATIKDENDEFQTLTKEQALFAMETFIKKSFNYDNFDKNGRFTGKNYKYKKPFVLERFVDDNNTSEDKNETLKLILEIQALILKFIKKYESEDK